MRDLPVWHTSSAGSVTQFAASWAPRRLRPGLTGAERPSGGAARHRSSQGPSSAGEPGAMTASGATLILVYCASVTFLLYWAGLWAIHILAIIYG